MPFSEENLAWIQKSVWNAVTETHKILEDETIRDPMFATPQYLKASLALHIVMLLAMQAQLELLFEIANKPSRQY